MKPLGQESQPAIPSSDTTPAEKQPPAAAITVLFSTAGNRLGKFFHNVGNLFSAAANKVADFALSLRDSVLKRQSQTSSAASHLATTLPNDNHIITKSINDSPAGTSAARKRDDSTTKDIPIARLNDKGLIDDARQMIQEIRTNNTGSATDAPTANPPKPRSPDDHQQIEGAPWLSGDIEEISKKEKEIAIEKKLFTEYCSKYLGSKHQKWLARWEDTRASDETPNSTEQQQISDWLTQHLKNQTGLPNGAIRLPNHKKLSETMALPAYANKPYIERLQSVVTQLEAAELEAAEKREDLSPVSTTEKNSGETTPARNHEQDSAISGDQTSVRDLSKEDWFLQLEARPTIQTSQKSPG